MNTSTAQHFSHPCPSVFIWGLIFLLPVFFATVINAQQTPHLSYVYPAGGRQGSTFTLVVGGQYFASTTNFQIVMDNDLATAKATLYERPLKPDEQQAIKDELNKFQEKRKNGEPLTPAEKTRAGELRMKMARFGKRAPNPALSEFMTLQFPLPTNAAPGDHEIRIGTAAGLSNPLKFCIGVLPETTKPDWKAAPRERGSAGIAQPPPVDLTIKLPATVNGQIAPAGVDRYRFWARQGQHLIISVEARRLIPYIADAVPGWFEATLTILDSKGKEVASAERYRFHPDPVVHFEVPRDGTYAIELHDSIYRGREDFIYRMTIGEFPFVTGIFPLGGKIGDKTSISLTGWNLPEKSVVHDNIASVSEITTLSGNFLNTVPFAVDDLPESFEHEPDNSADTVQAVTPPIIINGRISRPGESDVFKFDGHAGQTVVAEVLARRLDSPLDSALRLTDAKGRQLAFNDDFEDKSSGLETHHADSYLTAKLPWDGTYFIHITDTQGQGGPEFAYRLRISEPRPDFALRVLPSSLNVRAGLSVPVTVYAVRKDGFTNAIDLSLKGAPSGFSLSGARVPENQDKAQFTLKAAPQTGGQKYNLAIEGSAVVGGQAIFRPAVPAEDMMQAFAYRHLVASRNLEVCVSPAPRPMNRDSFKILSATPVLLRSGENVRIKISAPPAFIDRFRLDLRTAPDNVSLGTVSPADTGIEVTLICSNNKPANVSDGNLIFDVIPKGQGQNAAAQKPGVATRQKAVASLPAIPFHWSD